MTDILDRAQEREEEMRSDALAELARRADGHPTRASAIYCECGERIPEDRRLAVPGVQTCFECQNDIEKRSGTY
jgi:phage/conjugal plasmid C-4 type zinc finger TraR family protein